MLFLFTTEYSNEARKKSYLIDDFKVLLQKGFDDKSYGIGLNGISINFTCSNEPKGYEYINEIEAKYHETLIVRQSERSNTVNGFLECYIKFTQSEHDLFVISNDEESRSIFLRKIVMCLKKYLNCVPENIVFDRNKFFNDLEEMLDYLKATE